MTYDSPRVPAAFLAILDCRLFEARPLVEIDAGLLSIRPKGIYLNEFSQQIALNYIVCKMTVILSQPQCAKISIVWQILMFYAKKLCKMNISGDIDICI